jgi:hypothetical protein
MIIQDALIKAYNGQQVCTSARQFSLFNPSPNTHIRAVVFHLLKLQALPGELLFSLKCQIWSIACSSVQLEHHKVKIIQTHTMVPSNMAADDHTYLQLICVYLIHSHTQEKEI